MKKCMLVLIMFFLSCGIIMARCHYRECCECDDCYDGCDYYNCCNYCDCYDRYNYPRRCYRSGYRYYTVYYPTRRVNVNIGSYHHVRPINHPKGIASHPQHAAAARIHNNSHHTPRSPHGPSHHNTGAPMGHGHHRH